MAPAFSSTRQAGAFALLLLLLLGLPALVGKSLLPSRETIYSSLSWRIGAYPYIDQEIFEKKEDIDIAFIGSSHLATDIDTSYVQKALSEKLGRPAVVVSLWCSWHGLDALYFLTQDLLQNRKVRLIVFNDDCGLNIPHSEAWHWYRFGDNARDLNGLSLRQKIYYYYGAVIGMPRNLINLLRANLPPNLSPEKVAALEQLNHDTLPSNSLGAHPVQMGFDWRPDLFVRYVPQAKAQPSDACVYSEATKGQFDFSGPPAPPLQVYFAQKLVELATAHHTPLVLLLFPNTKGLRDAVIHDSPLWPEGLQGHAAIIGIPPAKLFSGLSEEEALRLFAETTHFNQNGQEYYAPLITPTLLQLYDKQAKP